MVKMHVCTLMFVIYVQFTALLRQTKHFDTLSRTTVHANIKNQFANHFFCRCILRGMLKMTKE